ncbi:hypothetical protein HTZ84_09675 [Haloterrigena sp. SYSU A558-1]|uniref:DUF190 domain-containing protein n=1 Tax=Haloterrigena gelatinilytica TaxID=2741724 RepID=A0ABX2LBN1_9EURY|nr:hypothetical protein [Haloterrigena gelatinilytica]NUC72574.1 hypothetical protein [Haloterrigena gelatinilytica]
MSTTNPETQSADATERLITSRTKKVRFYIPTEKDGAEEMVETVITKLARRFGGATRLPAKGAYVMNDGELVLEEVAVVDCFGVDGGLDELSQIAREIKAGLDEESVAFEITDVATAFA